jgi:hypothetical protein
VGVSKIEPINYAYESRGIQIWERLRWRCAVKSESYRPDFSSERAPHNNPETVQKIIKREWEKLVAGPRWAPDTKTDWLTVGVMWLGIWLWHCCPYLVQRCVTVQELRCRGFDSRWGNWFTYSFTLH